MPANPPDVIMEVAFDTDPLTRPGDGDWTDVTDAGDATVCVRSLRTRRGARTVTGQLVPGSASALIDYPGRVLEPFYDGSPWYPNVDLRKRHRYLIDRDVTDVSDGGGATAVSNISDGGDADPPLDDVSDGGDIEAPRVIWTGFISRLPNSWRRQVANVNLEGVGLLSLIANVKLPRSVLEAVLADLGPIGQWLLADSGGLRAAESISNGAGTYALEPTTVNPGVVPWGSIVSQTMAPATPTSVGQQISIDPLPTGGSTDRTLTVWLRIPPVAGTHADLPLWFADDGTNRWRLSITAGRVKQQLNDASEGVDQTTDAQAMDDGQPHMIAVRVNTTTDVAEILIDGSTVPMQSNVVTGTPDFGAMIAALTSAEVGFDPAATALVGANTRAFDLGPIDLFDQLLSDDEIADLWSAGVDAWDGDLTGERAHRILDLAGVDPADRDLDAGTQICGPAVLDGQTVSVYLRKIAQTEGGPIYEAATGEIALRERTANNPTVDFVLSDDPDGDDGTPFLQPSLDYSTARLINVANVSRPGSDVDQVVEDAASVLQYGPATTDVETLHGTPTGGLLVGARVVIRNKRPRLIIDGVAVSSLHWAEVPTAVSLDSDLSNVASFFARPPGGGDPIEQLLVVEAIEQNIAAESWTTSFGVFEHVVLPCFAWDDADAGWDDSAWCEGGV